MQKDFIDEIKFDEKGLVPVIAQDYETKEVLMLAYMNKESLALTLETEKAHYFSRSRNKIWLKGETSGNYQYIKSIRYDCDKDSILIIVNQIGGACHTGYHSCFYTDDSGVVVSNKDFEPTKLYTASVLYDVYNTIQHRRQNPKKGSYTNYLFEKGLDKMLKKVGEESAEVIIAAKNKDNKEMIYEISDLLYHLMVVMSNAEISWTEIFNELESRK